MSESNCPSTDDLRRRLQCEPDTEEIGRHLNTCPTCQREAERLIRLDEPLAWELPLLLSTPTSEELEAEFQSTAGLQGARTASGIQDRPLAAPSSSADGISAAGDLIFSRHRLLGLLGRGGMGVVCLGEHIELGKQRAFKFLPSERVEDGEAISRFRREWKMLAEIEHPNLISALDCGEDAGLYFLSMEYVPGVDLRSALEQTGKLSPRAVIEIARQAAAGLQALHHAGLIHRDIKPSNLFLGKDGLLRILDFGLARLERSAQRDHRLTSRHQIVGSPAYMAPEQFQDASAVDGRTDLYSLGCTLFTLLTGQPPYSTDGRGLVDLAAEHASPDIPDLTAQGAEVPEKLASAIKRLMQPDKAQRFESATELESALAECMADDDLQTLAASLQIPELHPVPDEIAQRLGPPPGTPKEDPNSDHEQHSALAVDAPDVIERRDNRVANSGVLILLLAVILLLSTGITLVTGESNVTIRLPQSPAAVVVDGADQTYQDVDSDEAAPESNGEKSIQIRVPNGNRSITVVLPDGTRHERSMWVLRLLDNELQIDFEPVPTVPPVAAAGELDEQPAVRHFPSRDLPELAAEPRNWKPNQPVSAAAIVSQPLRLDDYDSWTYETRLARGVIGAMRTSFDGTKVAMGSSDGSIRILSLPELELQRILVGQTSINSIRWVTEQSLVATCDDGRACLWSVDSGEILRTWACPGVPALDADIAYDGAYAAVASPSSPGALRSLSREVKEASAFTPGWSGAVAWAPNDSRLAISQDGAVSIFVDHGSTLVSWLDEGMESVIGLEWDPTGRWLAASAISLDRAYLIDGSSGQIVHQVSLTPAHDCSCRWSPDGHRVAFSGQQQVVIHDTRTHEDHSIAFPMSTLNSFDWIDGETLLCQASGEEGLTRISVSDGHLARIGLMFFSTMTHLRTADRDTYVACGTGIFCLTDDHVRPFPLRELGRRYSPFGFDVTGGDQPKLVYALAGPTYAAAGPEASPAAVQGGPKEQKRDLAADPTTERAAILYHNGDVWMWEPDRPLTLHRSGLPVNHDSHLVWSPDGKYLALGSNNRVQAWAVDEPAADFLLDASLATGGNIVAWSPDSRSIATRSTEGVQVFDLETKSPVALFGGQTYTDNNQVAWSPDGALLAAKMVSNIRVWSTEDGSTVHVIPTNATKRNCHPMAWSADGKEILAATSDGVLRSYSSTTGSPGRTWLLLAPDKWAEFSPDGRILRQEGLEDELVVVAIGSAGQTTLPFEVVSEAKQRD
ncbi:MAG: protein kinase [Planctomycetaceae bacterium]|nr:protein kinase [Planctomycetaceae bacterium]